MTATLRAQTVSADAAGSQVYDNLGVLGFLGTVVLGRRSVRTREAR